MNLAKIDTAKTFLIGPVLDADGVAVTGLSATALKVIKNGTPGDPNGSTTMTHSFTGHYVVAANAADISALGEVEFAINSTTNAASPVKFQVVTANVYDTFSSTDTFDVNVTSQANIDFGALQKTSLNAATPAVTVSDKTGFSLSATGADLILKSSTFIQAIVAAINELATYGLTAINTLLVTTGIKTATTAAPTDMALDSTVAKEATLTTVAGYLDTEIADILLDTGTTIPGTITALAATLKEVNQSLNGAVVEIDRANSTFKVYDTDGVTLLFTITKTTAGNVDTLTRS